jgi:hypothetical protein
VSSKTLPRYPVYIPSKGRYKNCLTAEFLARDNIPFYLVVEEQEQHHYGAAFGEDCILVLPFSDQGSVIPARNWIKDHATEAGYERHWQFDDNIRDIWRYHKGKRIRCESGVAIAAVEDFVDRYENIAIAGFNYVMFMPTGAHPPPFHLNHRVYSSSLVLNKLPHRWRGRYNEDTDICLQVLADGWCTVLFNAFLIMKVTTMVMKGGNTDELYHGDGRVKMARSLERLWPRVVETKRRFRRPQHVVKYEYRRFDTPLKLKPGIELDKIEPSKHNIGLVKVKDKVKSKELRKLLRRYK